MAGMEQLEIHSKSYLVRWVSVKAEHTISWSIRPDKKSINFGIFKHPGPGSAPTPKLPSSTFEPPPTPALRPEDAYHESHPSKSASSTATEKLKSIGLRPISWYGTCEANRVSTGTYDVLVNEEGMYALVFDNTFAKSFAKSATFVLLTYPTDSPPQATHHLHHIQGSTSESSTSLKDVLGSKKAPLKRGSSESFSQLATSTSKRSDDGRNSHSAGNASGAESNLFTGVLQKRRRKRHQGWARRFFSLDYTSSTFSYYRNKNTQAVRGAVPVSLAVISANASTRQISIDSGAEIWHLKAGSQKDFEDWTRALERARTCATPNPPTPATAPACLLSRRVSNKVPSLVEEKQWSEADEILKRVKRSRDAARSLAIDTDPKYLPLGTPKPPFARQDSNPISGASSGSGSPTEKSLPNGYFGDGERRPFWKRKQGSDRPMPGTYRSVSATPTTNSTKSGPPTLRTALFAQENKSLESHPEEEGVHDRCMSLLRDLDSIVSDFALLLTESKHRRSQPMSSTASRYSFDTQGDDEFFDAEGLNDSQLLSIHHESGDEADEGERTFGSDEESSTASEDDERGVIGERKSDIRTSTPIFPSRPKSLTPLPAQRVKRRNTVPPPTVMPPSLVGFLRKNVGKDFSTISMPVSANEPISLLQRISEVLEYSALLDEAARKPMSSNELLVYIAAFAIANFSCARVKERSIRKPFNPLLGETFELVREDRGFRFVSEKVSHRPVRLACQAESENWTLTQSPVPTQKFWGKSAELITEGKFRITLHPSGDRFSWTPATSFLRNIIAGEKYVEPVGTMFVANESTGEKAVVTFKSKGMFSGRSEEVVVQILDSYGDELPLGLTGKWTSSLQVTDHGSARPNEPPIWTAAELPPEAAKRYGFTSFAASLNEVTALERDKVPPTDSRLRPDQRAAEDGDFDSAEVFKAKLEEGQRERRKGLEEQEVEWQPKWFQRVEGADLGEEVWVAKGGKENYWEQRIKGQWDSVEKIFDV